ncbi:MAG: DNA polymerase III subunit beta [Desulfitobacteriaceae bacterium]|nr:DNA polymerase III subunit beta [Desulfitobacteriaceae bacterium]MDD4751874.1 DNA polymerase III subunit beta [Desulfitobacteriaceae bacterium]
MEVNCNKEDLLYGVQIVNRAVSNKNTLPVLGGILLEAKNNSLIFRATDLEFAIECFVNVDVVEEGTVVLPGRYFTEMVKRLPTGLISIKSNNNFGAEIKYEQSELNINGFDPEEFPSFPETGAGFPGSIDQDLFKDMIRQVSVAASSDETRPVFTGILMELLGTDVILVATDTHRLTLHRGIWKGDLIEEKSTMIIPAKTMVEIARIISDEPEPLFIMPGKNQIHFKAGNISVISRLIDGQYPNYRYVIPEKDNFKTKIRVRTKKLLETTERAALLARDDTKEKANLIRLKAEQEQLIINSNSPEIGKIYEEINIHLEGEPIEIVFNSKYLLDALKVVDAEDIYIELISALSPGIIRNVESEEYIYLILPVRTV